MQAVIFVGLQGAGKTTFYKERFFATHLRLSLDMYWLLRRQGKDVGGATALIGLSVSAKNELLYQNGINFNDLPAWQKRGSGLYWEEHDRSARNPVTGDEVLARRRRIRRNSELPLKDDYTMFLQNLLANGPTI